MTTGMHKVFLYGTVKRNQPFQYLFNNSKGIARFYGSGITKEKFPLVSATQYNIPYLLSAQGQGKNVHGEIYLVDTERLRAMDDLECPYFYEREEKEITMLADEKDRDISRSERIEKCYVYTLQNFNRDFLNLPCIEDFDAQGGQSVPSPPGFKPDEAQPGDNTVPPPPEFLLKLVKESNNQ